MKKYLSLIIIVAVILIISGINQAFNLVHCNIRRDYKTMEDRTIQNIKDKIATLEKEDIKDTTTTRRLAEQYALLGRLYIERKLWDQAIECYLSSEKYGGNGAAVMYALGLAYANRGYDRSDEKDFEQAEIYYRKSLEKHPGYEDAMYGLAILLYYHRNGKEEALTLMNELVSKNSSNYMARFALGRFYYENGDLQRSLQIYQQLQQDLEKPPKSEIINQYRQECSANISKITAEIYSK
ncbi:MAG TPA: tetratricopeptide repeat protein [Spirochaetota bacterium]|nr:tetratricopeptide repeat protein [Spirochaetota bacterium]